MRTFWYNVWEDFRTVIEAYASTNYYRSADVVAAHEPLKPFTDALMLGKRGAGKRIGDFVKERRENVADIMTVS